MKESASSALLSFPFQLPRHGDPSTQIESAIGGPESEISHLATVSLRPKSHIAHSKIETRQSKISLQRAFGSNLKFNDCPSTRDAVYYFHS